MITVSIHARDFTLTGKVWDDNGQLLSSANVILQNDQRSLTTITDEAGEFIIETDNAGEYFLIVSYLGYQTYRESVIVTGAKHVEIILSSEKRVLDEVIIQDKYAYEQKRKNALNIEFAGKDYLQDNIEGSLMQTLDRMAGVQSIGIGSGVSKPVIRGLGFNRVVVAENGIKHEGQQWGADHGLEIDQFAQDNVEVIKGPSSVMYGSDAISGVINLKQNGVPEMHTMEASLDLVGKSNNNLYGGSAFAGYRKESWFINGRLSWMDYADFKVPTDSVDIYSYRIALPGNSLRNTAGDELNFHVSTGWIANNWSTRFFYSDLNLRAGFFANAHGLEPRRVDEELFDRSNRDLLFPRQEVDHTKITNLTRISLPFGDLGIEVGFQNNFRRELSDYVDHGFMPPLFPDSLPFDARIERRFDKDILSGNVRLTNYQVKGIELSFGINSDYQKNDISGRNFIIPAFTQVAIGGYAHGRRTISDNIAISAAVRYDFGQIETESYHDWFSTEGDYLQRAPDLSRSFSNVSYAAGVVFNGENHLLKFNFGKSFRMPNAKELAANGVNYHHFSFQKGDSTLQPEQAYQLDGVFEFFQSSWNIQFSPFISYFPNFIYLNPSHLYDYNYGAGNQIFEYTGTEVWRTGGELNIRYRFSEKLDASLSTDFLYSEQLSGDKKGFTVPFSPPATALVNAGYVIGDVWIFDDIKMQADWMVAGPQNRIVPPENKTKGYQIISFALNGNLFSTGEEIRWNFRVHNLFNTQYLDHTNFYRLIGLPEPGRNFMFSLYIPFKKSLFKNN